MPDRSDNPDAPTAVTEPEPVTREVIEQIVRDTIDEVRQTFKVELVGLAATLETVAAEPNAGQAAFGMRLAAEMIRKHANRVVGRGWSRRC